MKKKKVEQSEFNKKLAEKMEAAGERMIEKMKPTRSEKQREYDRRYQAKKRAQKEAQKAITIPKGQVVELQGTLKNETVAETTSKQITPTEPVQAKKVLAVTITKEAELTEDYMYYRHECYRKDEEILNMRSRIAYLENKIYSLLENAR